MDEEYRKRATEGMAKGREKMSNTVSAVKPVQPKMPRKKKATKGELLSVQPLKKKAKTTVKRKKKTASVKKKSTSKVNGDSLTAVEPILASSKLKDDVKQSSKVPEPEPDGSITRLREERRDLYDLLYGDEEEGNGSSNSGESATLTLAASAISSNDLLNIAFLSGLNEIDRDETNNEDDAFVEISNCLQIPEGVSPNDDGKNDVFHK